MHIGEHAGKALNASSLPRRGDTRRPVRAEVAALDDGCELARLFVALLGYPGKRPAGSYQPVPVAFRGGVGAVVAPPVPKTCLQVLWVRGARSRNLLTFGGSAVSTESE